MTRSTLTSDFASAFGSLPYRLQLAGGWIDQPFVSRLNLDPPGSMVVVQFQPNFRPMDRAGFATGTREVAERLWNGKVPKRNPERLVRELYAAENKGKREPSGSQDMIGLVYPGISRIDYDCRVHDGVFPARIESLTTSKHARWLGRVVHLLPVAPRPDGYSPLGVKRLTPGWVARLGRSGRTCFEAIRNRDIAALGESLNETMRCWEHLLPRVLAHPLIKLDLKRMLRMYQRRYPGAMFSGCGGGYLVVVSNENVPGSHQITIRTGARS